MANQNGLSADMPKNLKDRPPKVFGRFTKKQLLSILLALAVIGIFVIILPFSFGASFLIGLFPAVIILIFGFMPENVTSPMVYVKYYAKTLIYGKETYVHNGDTKYYRRTSVSDTKIKRHKEYEGVR